MDEVIAKRVLKFKKIGSPLTGELVVEIYKPYELTENMVEFPISKGNAGCSVKFQGLDTDHYDHEVHGVDSLQALSMAVDVQGILKTISKTHELYFPDGDPYFELQALIEEIAHNKRL